MPRSFESAIVIEAVRTLEANGPLDDAQAMREAMAQHTDEAGRIAARAASLGQRIGLDDDLAQARAWAPWVMLALVALVVVTSLSLAASVTDSGGRHINVVIALASLLGLHLFTLALWLVGLLLPWPSPGPSFGRVWLMLTARAAGGRRGQGALLVRAGMGLLVRARLLPWAMGFASHAIWSLSFMVVIAALLFALAFRNYTLSWESTILTPAFFVQAVQGLGRLPGWFGFPVPDAPMVLAAASASSAGAIGGDAIASGQRTWALWLTGCIAVYGLLPRVLLAMLCAMVWRMRRRALQPDLSQPYFRKLAARFEALTPRQIVDADPGAPARAAASTNDVMPQGTGLWLIGFELANDAALPPSAPITEASASNHETPERIAQVDGSAASRREIVDALAARRPRRVVVVCRAASSPDRGTERFLRDVAAHCGELRIALHDEPATAHDDALQAHRRWQNWLVDKGIDAGLDPQPSRALRADESPVA